MKKVNALAVVLAIFLVGCVSKPKEFKEHVAQEAQKQDLGKIPSEAPRSITVSIDNERRVYMNNELIGTVEDAKQLKQKLPQLFAEKGHKTVVIVAPRSVSDKELAKVVGAVKDSGAHPIGLSQEDK